MVIMMESDKLNLLFDHIHSKILNEVHLKTEELISQKAISSGKGIKTYFKRVSSAIDEESTIIFDIMSILKPEKEEWDKYNSEFKSFIEREYKYFVDEAKKYNWQEGAVKEAVKQVDLDKSILLIKIDAIIHNKKRLLQDEKSRKLIEMFKHFGPILFGAILTLFIGWVSRKFW